MDQERGTRQFALLAISVLIGAGILTWVYWPRAPRAATPDELLQQALFDDNQARQAQAALQLRAQGAAVQLRQLVAQAHNIDVRAAAVQGLGDLEDFDSVPDLLRLCDDASPLVRGRAGAALCNILGADFPFTADAPPDERGRVIESMRRMYQQMRASPPPKYRSQTP